MHLPHKCDRAPAGDRETRRQFPVTPWTNELRSGCGNHLANALGVVGRIGKRCVSDPGVVHVISRVLPWPLRPLRDDHLLLRNAQNQLIHVGEGSEVRHDLLALVRFEGGLVRPARRCGQSVGLARELLQTPPIRCTSPELPGPLRLRRACDSCGRADAQGRVWPRPRCWDDSPAPPAR